MTLIIYDEAICDIKLDPVLHRIINRPPRAVFRTQSNICDEAFFQKKLTGKNCCLFSQKYSIVHFRLSSKYTSASGLDYFFCRNNLISVGACSSEREHTVSR